MAINRTSVFKRIVGATILGCFSIFSPVGVGDTTGNKANTSTTEWLFFPPGVEATLPSYQPSKIEKQFDSIPGVAHYGPVLKVPMPADATFEDLEFDLESETEGRNLSIVFKQYIGKAIAKRIGKPFPRYTIYHICNLADGEAIIRAQPAFGAFLPCKLVLYEDPKNGRIWALTYKPGFAVGYFPDFPSDTMDVANRIGDQLFDILYILATGQNEISQ